MRWSGRWDDLPAAHGAAIVFDLLVMRRPVPARPAAAARAARASRSAWRWPTRGRRIHTRRSCWRRTRTTRSVALACVVALLALTLPGRSQRAGGAGARCRSGPLGAAPSSRARRWRRCSRRRARAPGSPARCRPRVLLPFMPDGGPARVYDRTVGYQAARQSPFGIWGQVDWLGWCRPASRRRRWRSRCSWRVSAPSDAAQIAALARGGADRLPAGRDPLVLPLHRLVRPAGVRRALRARAGGGQAAAARRRPRSPQLAGSRICSIEVARPSSSASISTAFSHGSVDSDSSGSAPG